MPILCNFKTLRSVDIRGARNFPTGDFFAQIWPARFRLGRASALFLPRDSLVAGFVYRSKGFYCSSLLRHSFNFFHGCGAVQNLQDSVLDHSQHALLQGQLLDRGSGWLMCDQFLHLFGHQ